MMLVIAVIKMKNLMKILGKDILDWTISSVFADRDVKVGAQDNEDDSMRTVMITNMMMLWLNPSLGISPPTTTIMMLIKTKRNETKTWTEQFPVCSLTVNWSPELKSWMMLYEWAGSRLEINMMMIVRMISMTMLRIYMMMLMMDDVVRVSWEPPAQWSAWWWWWLWGCTKYQEC